MFQRYVDELLNKHVESEYYVNKLDGFELSVKFLAPLVEHQLVKFLNLNKKFEHHLIKDFYFNLKVTIDGLEFHFRNKLIKFINKNFDTHFGL